MAASGDGTGWDEASPSDGSKISTGPIEIRDLRVGVALRLAKEHVDPAASSVGGEHKMGSALAYNQLSAPTLRPDASTALTNADKGRLWFDGNRLWIYDGVSNGWGLATGYTRKAVLQQAHPNNTNAGTLTGGSWTTRILNTESSDPDSIVGLNTGTGVITLNIGTYRVKAWAVGYRCDTHQIRLRRTNNTAATLLLGSVEVAPNGTQVTSKSDLEGIISVTVDSTTFELQHYAATTEATNGQGVANPTGNGESGLYALCIIERLTR